MKLRSGISKELKMNFVADETALLRIKTVLDKAATSLDVPATVIMYVEREDDRFYETTSLDEVISDPNIAGRRISLVSLEIRMDQLEEESRREWIARVVFLAERKLGTRFTDTDEVHIDISNENKNWALLLADELEPQIERTRNRSKVPRWPLFGLGVIFVYGLAKLYLTYKDRLPVSYSDELKALFATLVTISVTLGFGTLMLASIRGKTRFLNQFLGPETVFLWGEEEKRFAEREQRRKNVFWSVVVAFVVSVVSSVAVALL